MMNTTTERRQRPLIFIATPCYGGLVTQDYVLSVLALIGYCQTASFDAVVALQGHDSLVTRSRNTLAAHFLKAEQATHLMFIDADIGFDPAQIERMVAFDQDVVCGVYPLKVRDWSSAASNLENGEPIETAALHYVGLECDAAEFEQRDAFVSAQYAGCGFMLIKRGALERMIEAYPESAYRAAHCYANHKPEKAYALFECEIDRQEGLYLSEDFAFCRRFRAIGGKIWLDTKGKLNHVGSHSFAGNPEVRFARVKPQADGRAHSMNGLVDALDYENGRP